MNNGTMYSRRMASGSVFGMRRSTVLIADDDGSVTLAATLLFEQEGIDAHSVATPETALAAIQERDIDLALIDLNYRDDTTSGVEGLELISRLKQQSPHLPIVAMTGWGTIPLAVEAMRRGAADFIEKPWDNHRLLAIARAQLQLRSSYRREQKLSAENRLLHKALNTSHTMVVESRAMKDLLALANRVAVSDIPVLITGENGTGKSLLARHIHRCSARRSSPLVSVNMGGVSESTFESEMFGHNIGAFTDAKEERIGRVELAEGGSLFLDEIGNTPLSQQAKLLRLLEEHRFEKLGSSRTRNVDLRVISATNADLDRLIEQHGFRRDLLYRLNGVTLHIPPLRQRIEDIDVLAQGFLTDALPQFETPARYFDPATLNALKSYHWPGNIRELHHVVERAVLLADQPAVMPADLQLNATAVTPDNVETETRSLTKMTLSEAEYWLIQQAFKQHRGHVENTARALGLSRSAFYRRLEKHGITDRG